MQTKNSLPPSARFTIPWIKSPREVQKVLNTLRVPYFAPVSVALRATLPDKFELNISTPKAWSPSIIRCWQIALSLFHDKNLSVVGEILYADARTRVGTFKISYVPGIVNAWLAKAALERVTLDTNSEDNFCSDDFWMELGVRGNYAIPCEYTQIINEISLITDVEQVKIAIYNGWPVCISGTGGSWCLYGFKEDLFLGDRGYGMEAVRSTEVQSILNDQDSWVISNKENYGVNHV